ncbi:hypothetical protein MJO28_009217 [Puccinia striiformis f. sp. tritici]|uniref:Uncharacterized protein n=1 Tax=Puccinia striiformis f. sp. tritici TaxID=168172 RepID=A0ACC0E6L9_9BASI|nr:hypothetical protein MJO28_009217 [Puccinia striiformis f. sp. tritici]
MHMVLVSKLSIQVIKTGQSRSTLIPTIRRGNPNNFMTKPSRPVCSIVLQSMPQLDPVIALSPNFQRWAKLLSAKRRMESDQPFQNGKTCQCQSQIQT